jgi:hypothetical protein
VKRLPAIFGLSLVLTTACGEWPRSVNLPSDDFGQPAPNEIGDLVEVEWSSFAEIADTQVPNSTVQAIGPGLGLVLDGTLDGTGWNDNALGLLFVSPQCDEERSLGLSAPGNWTGDVDAIGLTITEPTQLCASVQGAGADTGWDLLLVAVDSCLLPERLVFEDAEPLGLGLGADTGGWTQTVVSGDYQVLFAAYDPVDSDKQIDYRLTLAGTSVSNGASPCPTPPSEVE